MDSKRKASASRGPGAAVVGAGADGDSPPAKRRKLPSVSRAVPLVPVHCVLRRAQWSVEMHGGLLQGRGIHPRVAAALRMGRKRCSVQLQLQAWHGIKRAIQTNAMPYFKAQPVLELHPTLLQLQSYVIHIHLQPATMQHFP